ncbi:glycosyltransferase [Vibrio owensii]|uniref:Glycosyl transferase family 1 domain-containing protein n=1 Tax=Vibrio owensii CAIM 1854 = LMG 25443 TaxID=1229493 RepID=A0A0C1Z2I0_9VIBR|nr:glycosyltransferase [Vibrio owensii]KIF50399.1 hypothetical protein H735_24955 [Vibrio owensii CAIM 1854 = LMG 25443]
MNVLHVSPIPTVLGGVEKGGVESHVSELAQNLLFKGVNSYFFDNSLPLSNRTRTNIGNNCFKYSTWFSFICFLFVGARYFSRLIEKEMPLKRKLRVIADCGSLSYFTRKNKISLVHVHGIHNIIATACEVIEIPFVITDHGIGHKQVFDVDKGFLHRNICSAFKVISISDYSKSNVLQLVNDDKIVKINNPITINEVEKVNLDYEYAIFNGISDTWVRKGLSRIAEEIEHIILEMQDLYLVVVCNAEDYEKLMESVSNEYIRQKIKHQLPMDRQSMLSYVKGAKFNLAPSLKEGFSIGYLESILLGTPVIGFYSNICEMNDIFNVGYNIPVQPEEKLGDKVRLMMQQLTHRDNFEIVSNPLSWENQINKFCELYLNAIK